MTQLTFDGGEKDLAGTDGLRIYFNREHTMLRYVFAVPTAGGTSIAIPIAIPKDVDLEDVSPDGADLLLNTDEYGISNERPQWIVRALDGVPRHPLPNGVRAAFSPDGKFVVYSTHDGSIWLVGSDGEGAHKIASAEGAWGFAWSPDGGRIRFNKGSGHLWETTSSGSNLHQLLSEWHDSPWQCCGHWTADGSLFVFRSQEKGAISPEIWAMDERRGIFRHPPRTPIRLAPGPIRWTSILPAKDAKTLYATGEVLRGELLRFDSRTQQFQPFLGGISAQGAKFSPDGRFVVYVSWPDAFLFRANADGSNPVQLTDSRFAPFRPTWSPDGTQILFEDQRSEPSAIYLIPASGGVAQRVIPGDREPENDPTWSPDGKKIAFAAQPSERAKYHLRVVDLTTHAVSGLPGSMGIYGPRWSPDGRHISALTHDGLNLKVFDTITLTWTTVVQNMFAAYPQWSRDGHWLYFENADLSDKYSIRRVRVPGGKPEVVAVLPGVNAAGWWGWFGLDSTDAPLIMRDIGRHEIYAFTLAVK